MEQEKLTNQKEALAFLCTKYDKCFFVEGPVKPLKIGIFQDLAADLEGSEIVSKRLLRLSLRHYTSSWRYLGAVKAGVARIDLAGSDGDLVEQQHADHAVQQLKESKEKAAKHRAQNQKTNKSPASKHKGYMKSKSTNADNTVESRATPQKASKPTSHKNHSDTQKPATNNVPQMPITQNELVVGGKVLVKLGKEAMPVTITDISKSDISVQLKSGMTVRVKQAQLFTEPKAANK